MSSPPSPSSRHLRWWLLAFLAFASVFIVGGLVIWRLLMPASLSFSPAQTTTPSDSSSRDTHTPVVRLPGVGTNPVYLQTATSILRLDLSTSATTRTGTPPLTQFSGFVAGSNWVISKTVDGIDGVIVTDGIAEPLPEPVRDTDGRLLPGPTGRFWLVPEDSTNDTRVASLHNYDGSDIAGTTLSIPNSFDVFNADGTGNLLGQNAGGIYQITPVGARRISQGDLLATGVSHLLVWDCDDRADCKPFLIDRATHQHQRAVVPGSSIADFYGPDISQAGPGAVSPDGRYAALRLPNTSDGRWPLAVVDLRTGHSQILPGSLPDTNPNAQLGWMANSHYLLALTNQQLRAYDPQSARTTTVTITDQPLLHLAIAGAYTS